VKRYTVKFEKVEGMWCAQCLEMPGAISQGYTLAEVRRNIKEAIRLILETEADLVGRGVIPLQFETRHR